MPSSVPERGAGALTRGSRAAERLVCGSRGAGFGGVREAQASGKSLSADGDNINRDSSTRFSVPSGVHADYRDGRRRTVRLQPGQWTDDTSMAWCLAESLIECRRFDPVDQMRRYLRYWRD